MSNEVSIRVSLQVRKSSDDASLTLIDFQSRPTSYRADMAGAKGPTPGSITVSIAGTDVDLSELTTPGFVHLRNQDATNFVEWGTRDPETSRFYPVGELLPGESTVFRFSRNVGEEYYPSTGTGTSAPTNTFHLKANAAPCVVLVEAFEA